MGPFLSRGLADSLWCYFPSPLPAAALPSPPQALREADGAGAFGAFAICQAAWRHRAGALGRGEGLESRRAPGSLRTEHHRDGWCPGLAQPGHKGSKCSRWEGRGNHPLSRHGPLAGHPLVQVGRRQLEWGPVPRSLGRSLSTPAKRQCPRGQKGPSGPSCTMVYMPHARF